MLTLAKVLLLKLTPSLNRSPKKHKNVLITDLNIIANNFANYHMVQGLFSFLGEFLCFKGIFLCNGIANVIFFFFSNLYVHVQQKVENCLYMINYPKN